jgi:hypothetical protein
MASACQSERRRFPATTLICSARRLPSVEIIPQDIVFSSDFKEEYRNYIGKTHIFRIFNGPMFLATNSSWPQSVSAADEFG